MMEKNTIHHADWMTNDLPDGSVNLIIADPPYFEVRGDFDFVWSWCIIQLGHPMFQSFLPR